MLQDIWAEADALLATPPPRRATAQPGDIGLPSVWDDVDALLATPPPKPIAPARPLTPAGAEQGVPPPSADALRPDELALVEQTRASQSALPPPPVPPRPPMPGTPTTPGYFNPKTGTQLHPPALGAGALEDPVLQMAAGAGGIARAIATPPAQPSGAGFFNPKTGTRADVGAALEPDTVRAANDLAEGLMKAATPFIAAGALAEPLATATALVKATVASIVGEKGAEAAGASPDMQSLVGSLAAVLSGTVNGGEIVDKMRRDAGAVVSQARAFDAAHPEPVTPTEPIPVGRGTTPAAGGRLVEETPAGPPVPPRADLVPPGQEATFNAAQTPAPSETLTPETRAAIDQVLETPNQQAQREAAVQPPAPQDLTARASGLELERRMRAGVSPTGEERRINAEAQTVPPSEIQRAPPAAAPPVPAGPDPGVVAGPVPPDHLTPETSAEIDRVLQTPAAPTERRIGEPDAGIRQEPAAVDTPAGPLAGSGVEERPVVDATGTQPPVGSEGGRRPRKQGPSAAELARADEADTLDALVSHAKANGYAGDEPAVRRHLEERLELIKDLDREFTDSGRNPDTLLRDIARLGGISIKAETALKGELRWLKEFQDNLGTANKPRTAFGQVRGVQGVFKESGFSVDDMVTQLQQDPRYAHLDSLSTLLEEIRAAAMADHEGTAIQRLREGLGERWWDHVTPAAVADVLDTGETQTRLPGAADARQVGKADTSFKAPVQATSDDFAQEFLGEHDVPIEVEGDLFNDEPGNQGMPRRPFAGAWERLPRTPSEKPAPPVPPRKGPAKAAPDLLTKAEDQAMPRREGPPVPPRPAPSRGFFGKQELPANRPTTLPARRFGVKIRPLPVSEMVQKLTDLFGGVPVSTGRLYKGYLGVYQPQKESIRVQVADDLHVIAHEMGHHLDMAIMEGSTVFNRGAIAKELKIVGAPTSLPSYTAAMQRREGTAEFFRRWLTDPAGLLEEAPKFSAAFEQYLDRHPKIATGLRAIRNDVQRYVALPADEQARLHVDFDGGGRQLLKKAQALAKVAKTPEGRRRVIAYLSSQTVDDLAYLRLVEDSLRDGRPLDIARSAYTWARLARGHAGKAEGFLAFGVRDTDGTFTGPSLDAAIGPVLDRLEDFALYAAARRAKTLHRRGLESGFTASQMDATIEKYQSPVFDEALKGLRAFHKAKLEYMVRGGVLKPEAAARMLKIEPDYVPYWRVQDSVSSSLTGKKIANRSTPIKRMKGSGRRIANPIETIIRNTHAEVSTVEQNRAMGKLVQLALSTQGHGIWLEEIPEPQVATRFHLSELGAQIRAALEEHDVEIPQIPDMDTMLNEMATVFTPRQFARGNERVVTWLDGGKLRWFEIHDEGLYDALTAVGPQGAAEVVKLFTRGARVLQKMAVSTVGFLVRNPIKDQFSATVQSRAGYRPGVDFVRGLFEYVKQGEGYQLYLNSLADQATLVSDNRDLLRKRLRGLGQGKLRQLVNHTVLGPFDGLGALSHAGESATRIGEFLRTIEGAEEGQSRESVLTQAALNARDVSQDFQRKGAQARAWNDYVAFFAARVGGYGRMWEAFHENPTRFMWKALAAIALPSLALWILNHDDDEYNELPAWERNYYWHVPLMNLKGERTGFAKFPKPFELGQLFGTTVELALEALLKKDPAVAGRLMDRRTAMQLVEQVIPTAVLPWVEVASNYDFFRDRAIVSPWQEDLAPSLQYNRWTSETSKALGDLLDVSPAKIDTIIYGYTAGVGQGAMESVDPFIGGKKPAGGPGRWPGVSALYRPLATSEAESFTEFFTARDALAGLKASVKEWREMGREDKAQRAVGRAQKLAPFEQSIPAAERQLKDFRDQVNQVFASPAMSPQQKRVALDSLYLQMLNIVRGAIGKKPLARKLPPPVPPRPSAAPAP